MFSFDFDDLGPEEPQKSTTAGAQRSSGNAKESASHANGGYPRGKEDVGIGRKSSTGAKPAEVSSGAPEPPSKPQQHQRHYVVSPNTVRLTAAPGRPQGPLARVASMFMLLPSALGELPGVLYTYLWYHILAPLGPQLAHVFIFVDKPMGTAEGALATEAGASLERWLRESQEAAQLRPHVTLLDGSPAAALAADDQWRSAAAQQGRSPQREAEIRGCAAMGELCAKQVLNMERCIELARVRDIDWLICNLDVDEAFVCNGRAAEAFESLPAGLLEAQILNHEAVPETAEGAADYFRSCTLFKRCPYLLSSKKDDFMKFWSDRALTTGAKLAYRELGDITWRRGSGATEMYFTGYSHGKAAVRVAACRAQGILPVGPHRWSVDAKATARVKTADACILHYNNCEGAAGLARRYSGRKGESWNQLRMHTLCQYLYGKNPDALGDLFASGLLISEEDAREIEAQIKAGVCLRIRTVQKACQALV